MCVDRFHIVSLFLSNPCTPSTLSKEAFVYFVCPTEIPQPPFAWKCYLSLSLVRALSPYLSRRFQSAHAVHVFFTLAFDRSLPASLPPFLQTISLSLSSVLCLPVASAVIGLIKSAPDTGLRVTPMIPPRNSLAVGEVATCTVVSPQ